MGQLTSAESFEYLKERSISRVATENSRVGAADEPTKSVGKIDAYGDLQYVGSYVGNS